MPDITFREDEILDNGNGNINSRGTMYIGTKYANMNCRWILVKGDQNTNSE